MSGAAPSPPHPRRSVPHFGRNGWADRTEPYGGTTAATSCPIATAYSHIGPSGLGLPVSGALRENVIMFQCKYKEVLRPLRPVGQRVFAESLGSRFCRPHTLRNLPQSGGRPLRPLLHSRASKEPHRQWSRPLP